MDPGLHKHVAEDVMSTVTALLMDDHARLEAALRAAERADGSIDVDAFAPFRVGLLRHIGLEEKKLFPALRRAGRADPAVLARLRADHARIVALLVPTPTPALVAELRSILGPHDALEEAPDGLYARCDALDPLERAALVDAIETTPAPPVRPHFDGRPPRLLSR